MCPPVTVATGSPQRAGIRWDCTRQRLVKVNISAPSLRLYHSLSQEPLRQGGSKARRAKVCLVSSPIAPGAARGPVPWGLFGAPRLFLWDHLSRVEVQLFGRTIVPGQEKARWLVPSGGLGFGCMPLAEGHL